MADALDSGSSGSNPVRVQVPFSAFIIFIEKLKTPVFSAFFFFQKLKMGQKWGNPFHSVFSALNRKMARFELIEFTVKSSSGTTNFSLPSGIDASNSIIVGCSVQSKSNGTWYSIDATYPGRIDNTDSNFYGQPGRMLLYIIQ